jgi:hypothetical protein
VVPAPISKGLQSKTGAEIGVAAAPMPSLLRRGFLNSISPGFPQFKIARERNSLCV